MIPIYILIHTFQTHIYVQCNVTKIELCDDFTCNNMHLTVYKHIYKR